MNKKPVSSSLIRIDAALRTLSGNQGGFGRKMASNTAWLMLSRVVTQASGIIRLAILARFLAPSDFGLMAIMLLMLYIVDSLTSPGFNQTLIQREGEIDAFFPSVFSVNVTRGILLAITIWMTGPLIASFFGEPSASRVVQSAAAVLILNSLQNPAIIKLQRDLRFKTHFYWNLSSTAVSLATAIALAPIMQNVWVLVISLVVGAVTSTIGSYIFVPWIPKFRLDYQQLKDLSRFGKWVVASNIIVFISLQLDTIVVGRILGTTALGLYEMAFRISQLPATQISQVAGTVAFPALSRVSNDPPRFRAVYLRMVTLLIAINGFIAIALVGLAGPLIKMMFGPQWESAVPALQILAISGFVRSLTTVGGNVFYAAGHPKFNVYMNTLRVIVFATIIIPLVRVGGIEGAAFAVLISTSCTVPIYLLLIQRSIGVLPREHVSYGRAFWPRAVSKFREGLP